MRLSGLRLFCRKPQRVDRLVIRIAGELHVRFCLRRMPPYEGTRHRPKILNPGSINQDRLDVFDETRMVRGHGDVPLPLNSRSLKKLAKSHPESPMCPFQASYSRLAGKGIHFGSFDIVDRGELFFGAGLEPDLGPNSPPIRGIDAEEGYRGAFEIGAWLVE